MTTDEAFGRRATLHKPAFGVRFDRDGMLELHCTQHEFVRDQKGGRRAGEHMKFQDGSREPRRAGDARFNHVVAKTVQPSRIPRCHGKGGRDAQLPPFLSPANKYTLAAGPRHIERVPHHGKQPGEAGMSQLGLRGKESGRVTGQAEMSGIEPLGVPTAQDVAMRARDRGFFGERDHVRCSPVKERLELSVSPSFFMPTRAREPRVPI